ncbi:MAG: iron-containing alcohol dehydrogenase [Clostridiales bacterium]|jgi:alcohol dehydrogenase YqhD (iron-dependent ADH family)|nr:iron-containing alcohol dehydrogenase [Clostridiales bacterium]MBQ1572249.1 iron-containing alcohol dehydrogenase [Clostridiales bacterium]MBQ5767797.1 iron-containing alcohol dehydrogenase [Clostridiales bacterium]
MIGFEYYNPAKIVFGEDSEKKLKSLLSQHKVSSLLLVYSGDFIKTLGIYDVITDAVKELGIKFSESGEVVPNPSIELVRKLVAKGKEDKVDFVLAVGGGSSIDTAKAIALGIPYDGDVWDFFDKGVTPEQVLGIGVIATTASSGSETSNCAILSYGEWKKGFEDDRIIPKFAIMNPKYTVNLPSYQTFVGIADVLSHLLERYFSDEKNSDTTDYLIEGAVRALLVNADRLIEDPTNINARAEIQWLASVAHNNFLDAGRSADWGSHRIEHELSAQYNITHGEGMAIVFTAWTKYIADIKPWRLALLASRVYGKDPYDYSEKERALLLSDELEKFFKKLGIKTHLSELGIGDKDFEVMAQRATKGGNVGHYVPLDSQKIVEILKIAL